MTVIRKLWCLPYRVLRRFGTASVCYFFGSDTETIPTVNLPTPLVVEEMSLARIMRFVSPEHQLDQTHVELIRSDKAECLAVFDEESLAAFLWVAFCDVCGELNHTGNPRTELPLYLPENTAYVFHVLVMPEYRGRRLYGAMMSHLAASLRTRDIERLILTTEWTNESAITSVERMRFKKLGRSSILGIGPISIVRYPKQPFFGDVRLGRYAGDAHSFPITTSGAE